MQYGLYRIPVTITLRLFHVFFLQQVDDHVWIEVKNFTKCLIQMYAARGQQIMFMETAMNVRRWVFSGALQCQEHMRSEGESKEFS